MTGILYVCTFTTAVCLAIYAGYRIERRRETRERLRKFDERLLEVSKELDLRHLLFKTLLPLKEDMDRLGAEVDGRHAVVKISEFPAQHAFGIVWCCGFILDWK